MPGAGLSFLADPRRRAIGPDHVSRTGGTAAFGGSELEPGGPAVERRGERVRAFGRGQGRDIQTPVSREDGQMGRFLVDGSRHGQTGLGFADFGHGRFRRVGAEPPS